MIAYLSTLPIWGSGILLVALPTVLAMCGPVLIRKRIALEKLTTNNEIAGFKFATVGVIYAVLLAFAVIVVWERFSDGESAAGAAATFYRLNWASTPDAASARAAMTKYLAIASEQGWAAMERERESDEATRALNDVYAATTKLAKEGSIPPPLVSAMFQQLDTMTYARRTRLHLSSGIVPPVLWVVLFSGAALTIAFTFFFATENLSAQVMMTGILSVIVLMGLWVIVTIDHPFSGPIHIENTPLQHVMHDFGRS